MDPLKNRAQVTYPWYTSGTNFIASGAVIGLDLSMSKKKSVTQQTPDDPDWTLQRTDRSRQTEMPTLFSFSAGWIASLYARTFWRCSAMVWLCFLLLREIPRKLISLWRLGGEGVRSWREEYCGLEQAKGLDYTGIASLDLPGLFTSTDCCSNSRREIASSGYVVGFGKGFSTAFVMF